MTQYDHNHLIKDKIPLMISCDQATYLLSKNQHEEIGFITKFKIKMHLVMCVYCRRYEKQIKFLDKIIIKIKSAPNLNSFQHKLTSEQKEKIAESIKNQEKS
jgi:hypothetical protein